MVLIYMYIAGLDFLEHGADFEAAISATGECLQFINPLVLKFSFVKQINTDEWRTHFI